MASITSTGITGLDLAGYRELLNEELQALLGGGETVSVDPETPLGQIIGLTSLRLTEQDEALVSLANAIDFRHATGRQLDDLLTIFGVLREPAGRSSGAIQITGTAGTIVPAGSVVATTENVRFYVDEDVTIPSGGTVMASITSVSVGAITAAAGTITRIVTLVAGWSSVTNLAAIAAGRDVEEDNELKDRHDNLLGQHALSSNPALEAAVRRAGATRVRIEENDTAASVTRQSLTIAANSFMCIVLGGTDSDIASAIADRKPLGVPSSGGSNMIVNGTVIRFQRVSEIATAVTVTVDPHTGFAADGLDDIKAAILRESTTWEIGQTLDATRLYQSIYGVPGHTVTVAPEITLQNGNALPATPNLNVLYTLAIADITVSTS